MVYFISCACQINANNFNIPFKSSRLQLVTNAGTGSVWIAPETEP